MTIIILLQSWKYYLIIFNKEYLHSITFLQVFFTMQFLIDFDPLFYTSSPPFHPTLINPKATGVDQGSNYYHIFFFLYGMLKLK